MSSVAITVRLLNSAHQYSRVMTEMELSDILVSSERGERADGSGRLALISVSNISALGLEITRPFICSDSTDFALKALERRKSLEFIESSVPVVKRYFLHCVSSDI